MIKTLVTDRRKICYGWLGPRVDIVRHIWWKSINGDFWANGWNFLWLFWSSWRIL